MKAAVQRLEDEDHNKDGTLYVQGFIAALLRQEFMRPEARLTKEDLEEVFNLSAQRGKVLLYQSWLQSISTDFVKHFSNIEVPMDTINDSIETRPSNVDDLKKPSYNPYAVDDQLVQSACIKFENFIKSQKDLSLGAIFLILDTNTSNEISFAEFRSKLLQLQTGLTDPEIQALFKSIDVDNNQSIRYDELVERFATLNT